MPGWLTWRWPSRTVPPPPPPPEPPQKPPPVPVGALADVLAPVNLDPAKGPLLGPVDRRVGVQVCLFCRREVTISPEVHLDVCPEAICAAVERRQEQEASFPDVA